MPNVVSYRTLAWGLLYHMLGRRDRSRILLHKPVSDGQRIFDRLYKNVLSNKARDKTTHRKILQEIIEALGADVRRFEEEQTNPRIRHAILQRIVWYAGEVLQECPPEARTNGKLWCEPIFEKGKAHTPGFSRNPDTGFHRNSERDMVALAAVVYLLRAHALFFCRPKSQRDFNAAKTALNDLHQAYQLAWRLYHALDESHQKTGDCGLDYYLDDVITSDLPNERLGKSSYFVWNIFLVCEILRGNIYRQIDYTEEADRHYRHAWDRLDMVFRHWCSRVEAPFDTELLDNFVTLTSVKALFERSKLQFDLGLILESLQTQIKCIELLVQRSVHNSAFNPNVSLARLSEIHVFLEAERALPVYNREMICYHFGGKTAREFFGDDKGADISWEPGETAVFQPRDLAVWLTPESTPQTPEARAQMWETAKLSVEILARMGFSLFTLRLREIGAPAGANDRWLRGYFRFDEQASESLAKMIKPYKIKPAELGLYCMTLLPPEPSSGDKLLTVKSVFQYEAEREFAYRLRKGQGRITTPDSGDSDELQFYKAIRDTTTENIGNIITIPRRNNRMLMRHGYRYRRMLGDLSEGTVYGGLKAQLEPPTDMDDPEKREELERKRKELNKFIVLRRWQSFNPKIPRPYLRQARGGGYFLMWRGKGIVIDPGYDFIQNFYDEGFSLEDIDAVIVTHSHPDHDDDFASLTTLIKEWNEFHDKIGQPQLKKKLDLFLNESAHKKFSSWLQASDVEFGRIIPLPVLCWDKDSKEWSEGPFRGKNVCIDLWQADGDDKREAYDLCIEVVPAWHDDVIGKTAAVGLKFHLYDHRTEVGVLGYTGDTGAYGLDAAKNPQRGEPWHIDKQYQDCDILIAHLGDIRLRELATAMDAQGKPWHDPAKGKMHPLLLLLRGWFQGVDSKHFRDRVRDFLNFAITLDLVPSLALKAPIKCVGGRELIVQDWFDRYVSEREDCPGIPGGGEALYVAFEWVRDQLIENGKTVDPKLRRKISDQIGGVADRAARIRGKHRHAYCLLEFLSICTLLPWQYPYHLGIFGIYHLFEAMSKGKADSARPNRMFIIGELPEELTTYRDKIAQWLNAPDREGKKGVRAFTGDIGLHVGLTTVNGRIQPKIRCTYCNYNNELVCKHKNYHEPSQMKETPLGRLHASMIYLCTERDHQPDKRQYFLSRPEIRVV